MMGKSGKKRRIGSDDYTLDLERRVGENEKTIAELTRMFKEELKKKDEAELAVLNALASEKAAANVLDAMTTRITRAWRRPVAFKGGLEECAISAEVAFKSLMTNSFSI